MMAVDPAEQREREILALMETGPSELLQLLHLCSQSIWNSSFYSTVYLRCASWLPQIQTLEHAPSQEAVVGLVRFIDRNLVHLASLKGIEAVYQSRLIEKCLALLAWLRQHSQLDCHLFYVDSANQYLDLHTDYLRYRANPPVWSFLGHSFVLDVERKGEALRVDHTVRMRHELQDSFFRAMFDGVQNPHLSLQVRRESVLSDTLEQLPHFRPHDLRKQLRLTFEGEEAVDEGGVQKEFFQLVFSELLSPHLGLFQPCSSQLFWLSPQATPSLAFGCGLLLGLALYNSVLIDAAFPLILFKVLLGKKLEPADLRFIDAELWKHLQSAICLDRDSFAEAFPDLSWETRHDFVQDYAMQKLNVPALKNLTEGFRRVCNSAIIDTLAPSELELLLCGSPHLDFEALLRVCQYEGGFTSQSLLVLWFWEIVLYEMDADQQRHLLAFVTGCDRSPAGGLGRLPFVLCRNGPDADRLPSAHTCFNILLLNEYSSKERLKRNLFAAIENYEGFGLR